MPHLDDPPQSKWPTRAWSNITSELNFYRIHLIYFTVTPLVFSGIFYACNGRYHISYIDALYICFSSMCVCGLATINLSSLTVAQQAILFVQMNIGGPVFVSWFMVLVRRHYFALKFNHMLAVEAAQKSPSITLRGQQPDEGRQEQPRWSDRMVALIRPGRSQISVAAEDNSDESKSDRDNRGGIIRKLRPDMIRRMDDAPKLVNPSGWVTEEKVPSSRDVQTSGAEDHATNSGHRHPHWSTERKPSKEFQEESSSEPTTPGSDGRQRRRLSDPGVPSRPTTPTNPIHRYDTLMDASANENRRGFPRHQTIEFAPTLQRPRGRPEQPVISEYVPESTPADAHNSDLRSIRRTSLGHNYTINTQNTQHTAHTQRIHPTARSSKHRDFGGFPMPHRLINSAINNLFPKFKRRLTRTVTIPATTSLVSTRTGHHAPPYAKAVPYISFDAIVGRNSAFRLLTNEQMEELGGIEFRALNALLWLIGGYFFGLQLIALIVIAPYISTNRWNDVFEVPNLMRPLASGWFSAFQVVSAFTNTGASLVDQSMLPFQKAYAMVVFQMVLILGGNCAYPILLRLLIWIITKLIPRHSQLNETLHFLLDHPRRCYTYLFPSHQTWFLLTMVLLLTSIDWSFFMLLDIGNTVIEEIPLNTRFAAGLFQAVAVRAAGFAIVPVNSVAPAVKVLYAVMMYVSIYPIALSVRSTNVYEEQSLGVFKDDDDDFGEEKAFEGAAPSRISVWSRYLTLHIRRQLAFDMWWLAIAVFLICIVERHEINDPSTDEWFNVFNIMFEIVSAYGGVGLSLGITGQNYSLSGAFRPLSKLIVCAIILRGRHRGLPVAIDRAILLPSDLVHNEVGDEVPLDARSHHTQASHGTGTGYNPHPRYSRTDSGRGFDDGLEAQFQRRTTRRGTMSSISNAEPPVISEIRSRPVSSFHESTAAGEGLS